MLFCVPFLRRIHGNFFFCLSNCASNCLLLGPLSRSKSKPNREKLVPGFIRVEPEPEVGGAVSGDKWVEWEIMLSRFHPMKVAGADTYLTLGKAVTAPLGSNNQVSPSEKRLDAAYK